MHAKRLSLVGLDGDFVGLVRLRYCWDRRMWYYAPNSLAKRVENENELL